jgi:hypothetical protein
MYAMIGTRPDIACAVSVVSQFLDKPKAAHIELVQHILQYLKVNPDLKLYYSSDGDVKLRGYADASYGNEQEYFSRTGYGFQIGGSLISWYSHRQKTKVPAQSAAKAEYYAAVSAANEAIWLRQLLEDLGFIQSTVAIYEDNQACIALTKNPEDHKRTKHIQIKYHVVRKYVEEGLITFVYCPTKDQLADIFTKGVPGPLMRNMLTRLGLKSQGES